MSAWELYAMLAGMLLTMLLASLDHTIVGTAMPQVVASLHGFERYAAVTTAYLLATTVSLPVFSRLSDYYGRKSIYIAGTAGFVAASLLCGAAGLIAIPGMDGMTQLIVFRGLQGIGGGIIIGLIFTVISDLFSPADRGKYTGLFAGVMGISSIVGPMLGGWITDNFSWRWAFYVNLPVGLAALATLAKTFPHIEPHGPRHSIDWAGVLWLGAWIVPLLLALTWVNEKGWASPLIGALFAASAVLFAVFIRSQKIAPEPLFPLTIFRDRTIVLTAVELFFVGTSLFAAVIFLPLFMQAVTGMSAARSGSLITPMMLSSVATSILSGQIISRTQRYRVIAVISCFLMLAGLGSFSLMTAATTQFTILINMVVFGLGFGLAQNVYVLLAQHVAPREHTATVTAAIQFVRSIGSTVAVAVYGSILLYVYRAALAGQGEALAAFANPLAMMHGGPNALPEAVRTALAAGLRAVFGTGAVLVAIGAACAFFLRDPNPA